MGEYLELVGQLAIVVAIVYGSGVMSAILGTRLGLSDKAAWTWLLGVITGGILMWLLKGWGLL